MSSDDGSVQARASLVQHARRVLRHLPDLARDYVYAARHQLEQLRRLVAPTSKEQAVLLLPGIYETAGFLGPLRQALEADGNAVHSISALRLNLAAPEELAGIVARYLDEQDLTEVVCVAHSKGGLLAKQLLLDPRTRDRVKGAVALCTPFGGSGWASLFVPGLGVRSLAPRGRMITSLSAQTAANERIVSIYPTFDPHIPEGSRLAGARNVELPGFGHFQVLSKPEFLTAAVDGVRRLRDVDPPGRDHPGTTLGA